MSAQAIVIFFLCFIIYAAFAAYFSRPQKCKPVYHLQFFLRKIKFYDGATMFFSQLNHNNMNQVQFLDTDAMNKKIIATFTIPANVAGNRPGLVPGSLTATSSNPEIATATVGAIDEAAGTYNLEIRYSGKKGSADCKLIASADLDGSGDAPIEGMITSVIDTAEATGFGEAAISALQD